MKYRIVKEIKSGDVDWFVIERKIGFSWHYMQACLCEQSAINVLNRLKNKPTREIIHEERI